MSDDFPFNLQLMFAFRKTDIVGDLSYHDELKPSKIQLALAPGAPAVAVGLQSELEGDMVAVRILDAEAHAHEFPDYQQRLDWGYALCMWSSDEDPLGDIGWFSRIRLIPVSEEQHTEVTGWFDEGVLPDQPPGWLNEIFSKYTNTISVQAPSAIPVKLPCGNCGETNVSLYISHMTMYKVPAGTIQDEGSPYFAGMMSKLQHHCETKSHLCCDDCKAMVEIDPGEVRFPENHPVGKHLREQHHNSEEF